MNRETPLYEQIRDALGYAGLAWVERTQSGKVKVARGWMQLARIGTPDLMGYAANGQAVCLEVKVPGGKPRPEQSAFIERAKRHGAIADVVSSAAEAVRLVAGAIRGNRNGLSAKVYDTDSDGAVGPVKSKTGNE